MKNLKSLLKQKGVLFIIFLASIKFSNAQEGSYISMVSEFIGVKITITMNGDIAKVIKEEIPYDSTVGQRLYNTTSLPWDNGNFYIPDSLNYWYIPFDNINPFVMKPNAEEPGDCVEWYTCRTGECAWVDIGGGCQACKCGNEASNPCRVETRAGGGEKDERIYTGGGIIMQASSINLIRTFKSRVDSTNYVKYTVSMKNNIAFISHESITPDERIGMRIANATGYSI